MILNLPLAFILFSTYMYSLIFTIVLYCVPLQFYPYQNKAYRQNSYTPAGLG